MAAITAREFNQYTGRAKILAREEPVFITERGKVNYVLLSIEEYNSIRGGAATLADIPGIPQIDLWDIEFPRWEGDLRAVDLSV